MKEDIDNVFKDMDRVFKEMDKMFVAVDHRMMEVAKEANNHSNWKPHTLWWPKRVKGKWYWPTERVYRKFVLSPGGGFYVYGDDFDALRDFK